MKPTPTLWVMLLLAATLTIASFTFYKAAVKIKHRAPRAPFAAAAIEPMDDDYYKIPDSVTYNGSKMTNKAGLLTLSTELGHNYYVVNDTTNNTGFLYAEVKADNYTPTGKQRLPLNICLVIDRSGSMQGDKLANVKKAAGFLVDRLNDKDMLSIVVYESNVGVLQKPVAVSDKKALHEIIDNIETDGGTNLGGGMIEGYNQVKKAYRSGYVNRVLLLSDGLANEGITDLNVLQGTAKKWFNNESISISTFGVGNDYNENLMTTLAENGGGSYYYIKEPTEIAPIFEKEINGLLSVVAQQAKLTLKLPAGVSVSRVYGGNYELDNGNLVVNLKDVFANETKAILVKFKIKRGTNTELPFGTRLNFEDATNNNTPQAIENLNVMKPTTDMIVYRKNFSERVMQQLTMYESNDMLEKAMKATDDGEYDKARQFGGYTQTYLWSNGRKFSKNEEISKQDSVITIYNYKLKNIESMQEYDRKTTQKESKSMNYYMRSKK